VQLGLGGAGGGAGGCGVGVATGGTGVGLTVGTGVGCGVGDAVGDGVAVGVGRGVAVGAGVGDPGGGKTAGSDAFESTVKTAPANRIPGASATRAFRRSRLGAVVMSDTRWAPSGSWGTVKRMFSLPLGPTTLAVCRGFPSHCKTTAVPAGMPSILAATRVPAGPDAGESDIAAVSASVRVRGRTIARRTISMRPVATHVDQGFGAVVVPARGDLRSSIQR